MKELLLSAFLFAQGVSAGTVTGRLLSIDGTPAAGVRVTALSAPDSNSPRNSVAVFVSITQTDNLGRYRLENIPPGRYFITAGVVASPTYYPGVADMAGATVVTITSAAEISGVDFAIARGAAPPVTRTVTGSVVVTGGGLRPPFSVMFEGDGLQANSEVSPTGTFSFLLPPGGYKLRLSALPVGYSYTSITAGTTDLLVDPLKVSATDSPEFVVTIGVSSPVPWVKVAGHVTHLNNQPAAGATRITLIAGASAIGARLDAEIGVDGSFEFPMVWPGPYTATVLTPGSQGSLGAPGVRAVSVTIGNADVADLRVAIPFEKKVSGRVVVEGGGPAPQLRFTLTNPVGGRLTTLEISPQPDGTFTITVPEGESLIAPYSTPSGYLLKSISYGSTDLLVAPLRMEAANTQEMLVTVSSTGGVKVSGRVTGLDPSAAATSSIRLAGGPLPAPNTRVGRDGTFELTGVRPGRYIMTVDAYSNGSTLETTATLVVADKDLAGFEIQMPRSRQVTGHATADSENPLPRFWLTLTPGLPNIYPGMRPGGLFPVNLPEGEYSIAVDGLPVGYSVKSFTYGSIDLLRNPLKVSVTDTADLQVAFATAEPNAGVRVAGRVIGLNGATSVQLSVYGLTAVQRVQIAADGSFEIPKVLPGDHTFQMTAGSLTMNIPATGLAGITFAAVTGRLEMENTNRPTTGTVRAERGNGASTGVTSVDGSFKMLLAEGENRIVVSALPANGYVKSILYGTVDALNQPLKIDPNAPLSDLRITIGGVIPGR